MNYYIGDIHFGHSNVIRMDGRPFSNIEEMEDVIITNWNSVVKDTDHVYIVGDFSYKGGKPADYYLKKLKGIKHLVIGNHEKAIISNEKAKSLLESMDFMYDIVDNGHRVIICHYPLAEWNGYFRNAYHVYAHIHNNKNLAYEYMKNLDKALNAGCMINGFYPVTLDQLIKNNEEFKRQ